MDPTSLAAACIFSGLVIGSVVIRGAYEYYKKDLKDGLINLAVETKGTHHTYIASAYRETPNGLELLVYVDEAHGAQWWPLSYFKNQASIARSVKNMSKNGE